MRRVSLAVRAMVVFAACAVLSPVLLFSGIFVWSFDETPSLMETAFGVGACLALTVTASRMAGSQRFRYVCLICASVFLLMLGPVMLWVRVSLWVLFAATAITTFGPSRT